MKNVVIAIIIVVVLSFVARAVWQNRVMEQARDGAQELFPVWAGQGPFANGTESAIAMWAAWYVVRGPDLENENTDSFIVHKQTYDADPETWAGFQADTVKRFGDPNNYVPNAKEVAQKAVSNGELQWLIDDRAER